MTEDIGECPSCLVTVGVTGFAIAATLFYFWRQRRDNFRNGSLNKFPDLIRRGKSFTKSPRTPSTCAGGFESENESVDDADDTNRLYVYFGTQTGTAESFAKDLLGTAADRGYRATLVDLQNFSPEDFVQQRYAIFVVSTYGEGDPTDNAISFNQWLISAAEDEPSLQHIRYAVMGCGSREYILFNKMGIRTDEKLSEMGCQRICPLGAGDESGDTEADFIKWRDEELLPSLAKLIEASPDIVPSSGDHDSLQSKAGLRLLRVDESTSGAPPVEVTGADVHGRFYFHSTELPITKIRELRQLANDEEGLTVKHIELATCDRVSYRTADTMEVVPQNCPELVNWFYRRIARDPTSPPLFPSGGEGTQEFKRDALSLTDLVHFAPREGQEDNHQRPFPTPATIEKILTCYCDLSEIPPKTTLKTMTNYLKNPKEKEAMLRLLSPEEAESFKQHIKDRHMSLQEFLEIFMTSALFDFETFLQIIPRLKARPYSISSSSREDPSTISIAVGLVAYDLLPLGPSLDALVDLGLLPALPDESKLILSSRRRQFQGVCSSYLCKRCQIDNSICVMVKPSTFAFAAIEDKNIPAILVCAGTGVAPLRGFLRDLFSLRETRAPVALFFGCRRRDQDWLYGDEMQEASNSPNEIVRHLFPAFSRENPAKKTYVQHRIEEQSDVVFDLINRGAHFYICGSTSMGRDVRNVIDKIAKNKGLTYPLVQQLIATHRWTEELWG